MYNAGSYDCRFTSVLQPGVQRQKRVCRDHTIDIMICRDQGEGTAKLACSLKYTGFAMWDGVTRNLKKKNAHCCSLQVPMHKGRDVKHLYTKDERSNKFILLLEGKVEVTIGKKGLVFEAGPFHCFGQEILEKALEAAQQRADENSDSSQSLEQGKHPLEEEEPPISANKISFVPDFTAVIRQDITYLEIDGNTYLKAYQVSIQDRSDQQQPESPR